MRIGPYSGADMHSQSLMAAIDAAAVSNLDEVAKIVWRSLALNVISDDEAEQLSAAIDAKRHALASRPGTRRLPPTLGERHRTSRARRSEASILRRRRWSSSGAVPSSIAMNFTTGEAAVLAVVARQVQRCGHCVMFMEQMAAIAGVGRTTVRNALRQAQALGLLVVEERRITGNRNQSNLIRIVSKEWLLWLGFSRRGGCKKALTTSYQYSETVSNRGREQGEHQGIAPPFRRETRRRPLSGTQEAQEERTVPFRS